MRVCPQCREKFPTSERVCTRDKAVLVQESDMDRLGTTIGNYYVREILGRGGMGTVYSGEHVYIRKKVALKVLHAHFARFDEAVNRFLREARAASSINHPNIVDVTDFGPLPDGCVYFVMEYLDGSSLEDIIDREGALDLYRALNIANQIGLALTAAHEQQIVHRDLKPDNIMLIRKPGRRDVIRALAPRPDDESRSRWVIKRETTYDFVKVLDFGIAKVLTRDELAMTKTLHGAVFGTPEYMSPEAARGDEVDHRTDIYSLGVILFDMLAGRPPFEAKASAEVLAMHINKEPPSLLDVAPDREITPAASELVLRAMAKSPEDRYQSMEELRADLQRCYGSVAYRRNASSIPGAKSVGPEARARRLREEIEEWLETDPTRLDERQLRELARAAMVREGAAALPVLPPMTAAEEERIAAALESDLEDDQE